MEIDRLFELLFDESDEQTVAQLVALKNGTDGINLPNELTADSPAAAAADPAKSENLYKILKDATMPQKIKLAMFGNQFVRGMLIRDTNRIIPQFVLQNPRISENEINEFARNKDLDEAVLREIGNNSTWMKNYATKLNICFNPKVPLDVAMKWIKHLTTSDLARLGKSKNVAQVVATQSRKLSEQRSKAEPTPD